MKPFQYISLVLMVTLGFVTSCSDNDSTPPQAAATFTASKTTVGVGEEVQFTNSSQNATAFKWSFGDGTTSKEVSPKKAYTQGGSYVVSLVSTGAGGTSIFNVTIMVVPDLLYYITLGDDLKLRRLTLDPTQVVTDILDLEGRGGVGLAYDVKTDRIYFSDYEHDDASKIWSVKTDGSDAKVVVDGLRNAYQIVIDAQAGKIYWADDADDDGGHIGRANLDGSQVEKSLVTKEDVGFRAIALDPENNKMYYYSDGDGDFAMYVSNLDGTNEQVINSDVWGYALAVDTVHDKLYFQDKEDGLFMSNLDGTTIVQVAETDANIQGIIIDYKHNKLLWSERSNGTINRANLDGSEKEVLKSSAGSVRGLFLKN